MSFGAGGQQVPLGARRAAASAACLIVLVGLIVLLIRTQTPTTWQHLLRPYSDGEPLPGGFRVTRLARGHDNDVVVEVQRATDGAAVEVHILPRGRWSRVAESMSFGIGFEVPRSSAPEAESVAIRDAIADVLRQRDDGLPAPDSIPLSGSDVTALPLQLESLRAGHGTLVGLSLSCLGLLALGPDAGIIVLGVVVGLATLVSVAAGGVIFDLGAYGAWIPLAAIVLFAATLLRTRMLARPDCVVASIGFVGALALRLGLGAWGPFHINGQGPHWINGAARDATVIAAYGPGYSEVFGLLAAWSSSGPDGAIFAANACLSAALPAVAFLIARSAGISWRVAAAGMVVLAVDPVAIRMAATESYFPLIMLSCGAAALALLRALRERPGGSWRVVLLVSAGVFLALAARTHPAAWVAAASVGPIMLAAADVSLRIRCRMLVAGGLVVAGVLVASSGGVLLDVLGNLRSGALMRPPPPPVWWPLGWASLFAVVLGMMSRRWGLALCAGISALALLMTHHVYAQSWLWQQSYQRLYVTIPVLAVLSAIPAPLLEKRWGGTVALAGLVVVWWVVGLPILTERSTDHLEYRWLRSVLAAAPSPCRIIHQATAEKRGIFLPVYVGPVGRKWVAVDDRLPHSLAEALAPTECLYYVRTSLCSSAEGRPRCARLESQLQLTPVARAEFPARPSYDGLPYDSDPVEVVVARAVVR
jgi:hypothetical protein